jgi:hypothetical protein
LKLIRIALPAAVALVLSLICMPGLAAAASNGGIAGTVRAPGGAGIGGIEVCAFPSYFVEAPAGGNEGPACATTEAAGKYSIGGLAAGPYEVQFRSPSGSGLNYVPEFYPEAFSYTEAEPVNVNGTSTRTGIDAVMQSGSRLSGRVEDATSHAGLAGIQVCAFSVTGGSGCAGSGADGTYTIGGLSSGSYTVDFYPQELNYALQYYEGASTYEKATLVKVGTGVNVTGIDASMQRGAKISGTVTAADTHAPVEEVSVCAFQPGNEYYRCVSTAADGTYSFEGLAGGEYSVSFSVGEESAYASRSTPLPVTVAAGGTVSGADVELQHGGTVAGTITSTGAHAPLAGVNVCALTTPGGSTTRCATTDSSGKYTVKNLAPGEYKIEFVSQYEVRYYDGATTLAAAQAVPVHAGAATSGIDGELAAGAEIAGTVTDAVSGEPIAGAQVCGNGEGNGSYYYRCAQTSSSGTYALTGLQAATYRVQFTGPATGGTSYVSQYYDGASEYGAATLVTVGPNERRAPVDAHLKIGGWIEGTVKAAASGERLIGIGACAYEREAPWASTCASTGANGEYKLAGLPGGQYSVYFEHGRLNFVNQYYGEAGGNVPPVTVTVGGTTTGIDAALASGAEIRGRVTSEKSGAPLAGVSVTALPRNPSGVSQSTSTDTEGRYMMRGLRGGEYTVEFNAHSSEYGPGFYDQRNGSEPSDTLTLTAGVRRTGIDAALTAPPPVEIAPPTISGTAHEGQTLTEAHGSWSNGPTSFEYRWLRCDSTGTFCTYIGGATGQTYTLEEADAGHTVKVEETATNKGGQSYSAASEPTAVVVPDPPVNVVPPGVDGFAQQGQMLFVNQGEWRHEVSELGYRWLRCDAQGNGCTAITGAVDLEYEPVAADVGHTLRVRETASNAGGAGQPADSEPTAVVVPPVPTNQALPTIGGTAKQSETLTESHGSWTYGPDYYDVRWLRCDAGGGNCVQVASGTEYVPVAADVGHTMRVRETATNAGGTSAPAESAPSAVVLPAPPVSISPPGLSGTAQQGKVLTESQGSWTNEPTSFEYQWMRCDEEGNGCAPIPGAGARAVEYEAVAADVGHRLRVSETAVNAGGPSAPAESAPTAVVVPPIPTVEAPPTIAGIAQQGRTLTEAHGEWTYAPTSFTVRWLRCDLDGSNCAPIAGAGEASYVPTAADIGHTLEVEETATNAGGTSAPALSAPTAKVEPAAPVATAPPTVVGQPQNGLTLVEQHGTWTNEPTSYTYRWLRCDAAGAGCAPIAGAVDPTYKLTGADIGHAIEAEETAANVAGPGSPAASAPTAPVAPIPLNVSAGDDVQTTEGVPVHFDGTGSGPAAEIDHYRWQFGDGAEAEGPTPTHTYATAGTFTATLTVSRGGEGASASVTVTVAPVPRQTTQVKVTDKGGAALPGATVLYIGSGGERIEGVTDGGGAASLAGLPDGVDTVYAYQPGYQPATAQVMVSDGGGETTVALESGALGASTLKSHEMTKAEIEAAGIDVNDPANQNVYEFEVRLAFLPNPTENVTLHCYINDAGEFVGQCGGEGGFGVGGLGLWGSWGGGGGGSGGGGPSCSPHACVGGGIVATPIVVDGHPAIQWLILRGKAAVLKQFFQVTEVVQNLSPAPFEFAPGTATLDIPAGMSLAPTAEPQSAAQSVPAIAGEGSAEINWIVRGDEPGEYPLAARYHSTLEPLAAPVDLEARLATPLHVWGAAALELHAEAEGGKLVEGQPYRVKVSVTNKADVPISNIGVEIFSNVHSQFIFQPGQKFSESIAELKPGETISAPLDILVPDAPSEYPFNPSLSSVHFVGETVHPGQGISTMPSAPLYGLSVNDEAAAKRVHLSWQPDPNAEGYEVYSTSTLDTPFPDDPEAASVNPNGTMVTRLPANATEAYVPFDSDDPEKYYAVSTIVDGTPTLDHSVVPASFGSGAEDWGYCIAADGGIAYGAGTAGGTACVVESGDGSQAYLLLHGDLAQHVTAPPNLNQVTLSLNQIVHSCAAQGSASVGAIAFEGPVGEDPGSHHYATVNGDVGVSLPLIHIGVDIQGALMQSRDQSTSGLYYAYGASFGVGCSPLPFSATASTEADYGYKSFPLTGADKTAAIAFLQALQAGFGADCGIGGIPNCALFGISYIGSPVNKFARQYFQDLYVAASGATSPPAAPSGIGSWTLAGSDKNDQTATATSGELSASARGIGSIGIGPYGSEPHGLPVLRAGSSYFDVKVSKPSIFSSVSIHDCDIGDATSVQWWDDDAQQWKDVSRASFNAGPPRCVTIIVGQNTSPSLSQLTGTVFGASPSPAAPSCAAPPSIATQPASAAVTAPAEASFAVAEGPVPANCAAATVQWQQSGDGGASWSAVSGGQFAGANGPLLRIAPTAAAESGRLFRAVLSNAYGSTASAAATLTVAAEPGSSGGGGSGTPAPSGGSEGSGGGAPAAGGGSAGAHGTGTAPASPAKPKPVCKKGFKRKKVKGKARCVKAKPAKQKAKGKHRPH